MTFEMIVTSSVLIAVVIFLRILLKGKISSRLQYAVWLVVAVRLLLLFPLLPSRVSVMNSTHSATVKFEEKIFEPSSNTTDQNIKIYASTDPEKDTITPKKLAPSFPIETFMKIIWYCGIGLTAALFLTANLIFYRKLRKNRVVFSTEFTTRTVYLSESVSTPCVFGIIKPSIYITEQAVADESALRCILAHEEAHLRQGDPFWNIIRICCIAIHWFNPFVWIAAGLSRQDAELSCDATAIRALGAESRFLYGRTLVGLLPVRSTSSRMFFCGTSLSYGRKGMKERISRITKKTRTVFPAAILLFLCLAVTAACTFTGQRVENINKNYPFTQLEQYSDLAGLSMSIKSIYADKNENLTAEVVWENNTDIPELCLGEAFTLWRLQDTECVQCCDRGNVYFNTIGYIVNEWQEHKYTLSWYADKLDENTAYKIEAICGLEGADYSFGVSFRMEEQAGMRVYCAADTIYLAPFSSFSPDAFYQSGKEIRFVAENNLFLSDSSKMDNPQGVFAKSNCYQNPQYIREEPKTHLSVMGDLFISEKTDLSNYESVLIYQVLDQEGCDTGYRIYYLDKELWIGHFDWYGEKKDAWWCEYIVKVCKKQ